MNQGAESTVSYLMARLAVERTLNNQELRTSSDDFQKAVDMAWERELVLQ